MENALKFKLTFWLILVMSSFSHEINAQIGVKGSKWLYANEGPIDDCSHIMLEALGDTVLAFNFRDTLELKKLSYKAMNYPDKVVDSFTLLVWHDSINGGVLVSVFLDSGKQLESIYNDIFTYSFGTTQHNDNWHAPINGGFSVGKYGAYARLSEDTFWFNDSISSYMYTFEKTPANNYLCETVITRIGSMGFFLALNRDKPDYRGGRLLWYYDPQIDTFHVPDTFGCNLSYTSWPTPALPNADLKVSKLGPNQWQAEVIEPKGWLLVHDVSGKLLLKQKLNAPQFNFTLAGQGQGMYLISYLNEHSKTTLKIVN